MKKRVYNVANMEGLPLSEAVRFGDLLFVSGAVGMDDSGRIVDGGITAETEQTMHNIKAVLHAAGCSLTDVLKVNVVLSNAGDFADFNQAYGKHFPEAPPARISIVAGLTIDARVEIDVIAGCSTPL